MAQLEFSDFSGGITDLDVPGTQTRYLKADNLLITDDRKLAQRPGFDTFLQPQLDANVRVARLANFDAGVGLLAIQGKKLFGVASGAWAEVFGPTGNHAFNTAAASHLVETDQWNHQRYFASSSGDPVVKTYRDENGIQRMRQAGLPKPATSLAYPTDASKLSAAISLGLAIRGQFLAHVDNSVAVNTAHRALDTTTKAGLVALSSPTDLPSLGSFTKALRALYNAHVTDARQEGTFQLFHAQLTNRNSSSLFSSTPIKDPILNLLADEKLAADAALDTLPEIVLVLNDLKRRYNWHTMAPETHGNALPGTPSYGGFLVTSPDVLLEAKGPQVGLAIGALLRYVNYMKGELNHHVVATGAYSGNSMSLNGTFWGHRVADTAGKILLPDATDLPSAVAMLAHFEYFYARHYSDANYATDLNTLYKSTEEYVSFRGTITSGSNAISVASGQEYFKIRSGWTLVRIAQDAANPYFWDEQPPFPAGTVVASTDLGGSGTVYMFANATATKSNYQLVFARSKQHLDVDRSPDAQTSYGFAARNFLKKIDLSLDDLEGITLFAKEAIIRLKAHMLTGYTVFDQDAAVFDGDIILNPDFTYWKAPSVWTGTRYRTHTRTITSPDLPSFWPAFGAPATQGEKQGPLATKAQGFFELGLTVGSYNYKIVYRSDYSVGTTKFVDLSSPSDTFNVFGIELGKSNVAGETDARDPLVLSNIPILTNAANENYPTTDLKLEFYRTQNNGTVYYKTGEIVNGTTTFSDKTLDEDLVNKEGLYTNGGIVSYEKPPVAKHIHVLDGRMYYGLGTQVFVSLPDDPDSVPATFFDDFDEEVIGISSTRSTVVVLCSSSIQRLVGAFDDLGSGFLRHETVFDKTGCISSQSIVKADNGVYFAGADGFYFTDGFQAFRVSDLQKTFKSLAAAGPEKIQGTFVAAEKRIYWTMPNNTMWVMDLKFGVNQDAVPFTTFSGGFDGYAGFTPQAVCDFADQLHYGDSLGYIFHAVPGLKMDLVRDPSKLASSWEKRSLLWDFKSCASNFGTSDYRKYFLRVTPQFLQETNLTLQIISDADKGRIVDNLPIIRSRKLLDWGDPKIDWTSSVYAAKEGGVIDEFRRYKGSGGLRSNYRALGIRNGYSVVVASDQMGNVNVASAGGGLYTLTLIQAATRKWPLYSVGYEVKLPGGASFPVVGRVSDTVLQVSDPSNALLPSLNSAFELWGYPKNEAVRFIGYTIDFEVVGQTQKDFQGVKSTDGGQNATS